MVGSAKYLTDEQLERIEYNPEYRHFGGQCPVCLGSGKYRYQGEEFACPDDDYGHVMLRLAKQYWLANIPLQYQQLNWQQWPHPGLKPDIMGYLNNYHRLRLSGMGLTFRSSVLGVGKTWGATYVLRELVKRGYDGWFAPFYQVKGYYDLDDKEERAFKIERVMNAEILVLDEVREPYTQKQRDFYADKLEELIRPRTDSNLPTLMTTNMSPDELEEEFPRVFSLLNAKNLHLELMGTDARASGDVWAQQWEMTLNDEAAPIT